MFTKTGNNDWIDYAWFVLAFFCGIFLAMCITTLLGIGGFLKLILVLGTGIATAAYCVKGSPESIDFKFKTKRYK
jgi:uncharacterized membrane protein